MKRALQVRKRGLNIAERDVLIAAAVLQLKVTVGAGELPLCVELSLLHSSAPGQVEVFVAASDAGFCALR